MIIPKDLSKIDRIKKIPLFRNLTEMEISSILDKINISAMKKGEIVIYPEDTNDIFYAILDGKIKITKTDYEGKEIILAFHDKGDFFGELSLIDGRTCPATAVVVEDAVIAFIRRDDFYKILHTQHKVVDNLLELFCGRLRYTWSTLEMLTLDNAAKRIRKFFLIHSNRFGSKKGASVIINIKLTHKDIADMTGVTRETVTRILNDWKKTEEISILRNRLISLNESFFRNTNDL
ncbi:CRP/FNR family transcriptional regulator [Candidatus Magnetoovum chiemensis]|nr:CRP/FNR family transcriptional regulator [Candidatus Magnetoovum chiemensis]